ncbi:ferredoxin--NADP reductase [Candidatus Omnitrophota bacterium]
METKEKKTLEFETELLEVIERAPDVKSFRFTRPEEADFTAGQYFMLYIDVNGEEKCKPFSFSSSPTERAHIEFTKRLTGSDFSEALNKLEKGDKVRIKMPFGSFTLKAAKTGKIAFLCGGIGITPVRSMAKYAADISVPADMVLLYGNAAEEEIIFREDLDGMEKANPYFKVIYTLTCSDVPKEWKGCCGFINKAMIEREMPDFEERTFYACGSPYMVKCMVDELKGELKIPDEKIVTEHFLGYEK